MELPTTTRKHSYPPTKLDTSDPRYIKKRLREMKRHRGLPVSSSEDEKLYDELQQDCVVLHKFFNRRVTLRADNTVVKAGKHIRLQEVDALRVAEAAGLPVPHVFESGTRADGLLFIRMSFIEGQPLHKLWDTMDDDARRDIISQLQALVKKMRSIEAPPNMVGGCDGKEIRDTRTHMTYYAPNCKDEKSFNQYLTGALSKGTPKPLRSAIEAQLRTDHRIVLSHCDLAPRNIMVKDGRIMALIDWEEAGWYPEYWDYVKFFQREVNCVGWTDWADEIFSKAYPVELLNYLTMVRHQIQSN